MRELIIHPKYEHAREWLEQLPETFTQQGRVIYEERNQIRLIDGYCVKRFARPKWWQRIVYVVRKPKAQRAYEYALRLRELGIGTPEPVAYILGGQDYLVTRTSELKHTFYDFRDGKIAGKEALIRAFAQFTARVHEAGVKHLDYSPGNILNDEINGQWQFELVDINRLRFGAVSPKEGCYNFCRLWGKRDFFEVLSQAYAEARHIDPQQCLKWILDGRKRFWAHRSHEHFVTDDTFRVSVIIATYNNPDWLEKVLWGLQVQTHPADEIIIADDGSDARTKELVARYASVLPLRHVWHKDDGFRKTTILNKAIMTASGEYLIFMDHDLIPRRDFIYQHYTHARKGRFISGGAILLPKALSHALSEDDIKTNNAFSIRWLRQHGLPWNWKMSKLWRNAFVCRLMNLLTPTNASWNGGNASAWRQDILAIKGFDTRMRYGAEDREFGQRLENMGITGIQLRYNIPLLHLYHERPYRNDTDWKANLAIWAKTRKERLITTDYGL